MSGIAEQLLREKNPLLHQQFFKEKEPSQWPLLSHLLASNCFSLIDWEIADKLLKSCNEHCEKQALFICYLSLITRLGHLCFEISSNSIHPEPLNTWKESTENFFEIDEKVLSQAKEWIIEGALQLPPLLMTHLSSREEYKTATKTPLYRLKNRYYFQRFLWEENQVVEQLDAFLNHPSSLKADPSILSSELSKLIQENKLLPEQAEGIPQIAQCRLSFLFGGPGTGKTHVAAHLIKLLWKALEPSQRAQFEIALAAPTGKAATHLQSNLMNLVQELESFPTLHARTLHSLLEIHSRPSQKSVALSADLLLVDESSMIDLSLMRHLLSSLKPTAHLIFLGDPDQLPPVGTGTLFADLLRHFKQKNSPQVALIELKKCLRTESIEILECAKAIKEGNRQVIDRLLCSARNSISSLTYKPLSEIKENRISLYHLLEEKVVSHFYKNSPSLDQPEEIFHLFNQFRILSPLRKGCWGVDFLNEQLFHKLLKRFYQNPFICIPIIFTTNDHRSHLFNGETAILVQYPKNPEKNFALCSQKNGGIRKIATVLLPKYDLAYCISIHKSQGSEFSDLLLLLPPGSEIFGRELLYTGITRAKYQLEIWSTPEIIKQTTENHCFRLSGI